MFNRTQFCHRWTMFVRCLISGIDRECHTDTNWPQSIQFNQPVFKVTDKRWRWEAFPLFSSFYWHCRDWHPAKKNKKKTVNFWNNHLTYLICTFDIFDMFTLWGSVFWLSQLILRPRSLMFYLTHKQSWQSAVLVCVQSLSARLSRLWLYLPVSGWTLATSATISFLLVWIPLDTGLRGPWHDGRFASW